MLHLIPSRQSRPSDDAIFALNAEANRRKAAGDSILNATLGTLMDDDGRLAVLETAARALHEVKKDDWAAYAPIAGTPDFLAGVIDDVFHDAPAFKACATAAATPGGTGALRHALTNYLEPGQALLTTSFYWGPYNTLADEQGRRVETFSMFAPDGTLNVAGMDAALTKQLADQGRALLILNDPCHNPTGYSMRESEWQQVAQRLLAHAGAGPVTLLVDMAYYLYGAAANPRAFLAALEPLLGKVGLLFAWSASKSFTHYGLRVGALIACEPDETARAKTAAAFNYAARGTWSNCNRGGMALVARLLNDTTLRAAVDAERETLKRLLLGRAAAFNELARPKGLLYPRYEGGFFVTVFTDNAAALAERARGTGVFAVPLKGALRVALCSVPAKDVPRLVEALSG